VADRELGARVRRIDLVTGLHGSSSKTILTSR
jgi:hypothetical protein